jgi:hypothetical protein
MQKIMKLALDDILGNADRFTEEIASENRPLHGTFRNI